MCAPICKTPPSQTGKYIFHITDTVNDLPCEVWDDMVGEECFFARSAHLSILEKTSGKKIQPLYVLVNDGSRTVAVIYIQQLIFSFQNAVKSFKWEQPYRKSLLSWVIIRMLSFLKIPLLHTGNVFFTGDSGIYFGKGIEPASKKAILRTVIETAPWKKAFKEKPTAFMLGNLYDQALLDNILPEGFHKVATEPDLWMNILNHWTSFEDFLADLSSKYRLRANKVFALTSDIMIQPLTSEEIRKHEDWLLHLYKAVADKSLFNLAHLPCGCLAEMKELYGENFQVNAYCMDGQIIGFTSAFYIERIAHAYYVGIDYERIHKLPLYNRMLLEHVKASIQRRCRLLHFGRTATEIKTTVGAQPVPMHGYLKLENRFFNRLLPLVLGNFGNSHYTQRHPFRETVSEVVPPINSFEE